MKLKLREFKECVHIRPRGGCGIPTQAQSRVREKMVSLLPKEGTLEGPRTPHRGETSGSNWNCTLMNSVLQLQMRKKRALRDPAWSHRDLGIAQISGEKTWGEG